jgi:hypothetical protein
MTFGIYLMLNVVLILFLALWVRRLIVRRLEPERILDDLSTEIGQLIAELNQTGDHNVSVLEDRIMQLRDLVADADRQIEELSSLLERVRSQQAPPEEPVYTVSFSGATSERDESSQDDRVPSDEDAAPGPLWESHRPQDEDESLPPDEPRLEVLSPREQVRELHQQGLSSEIIAGKTGMAIGEVELIISLGSGRGGR